MAVEIPVLKVNFAGESIVKANCHPSLEPRILTLSNLDLLSGRFPVTYFYFYPKNDNFFAILHILKSSLAETLNHYYPFAGRIVENQKTGEPEIVCDNNGALVVEACANISLKQLNFYNLNQTLKGKLVRVINDRFPLQIQITGYTCEGVSITFTFDHALGDATSFGKFLISLSEIARAKPLSCIPDHRRDQLSARSPPTYHPSLDQAFVKCTMDEILNIPTSVLIKRLYYVEESSIDRLQRLASLDGTKRTKIEAFSWV